MIETVARGIPADVTVRLRKVTVTATVKDAIFLTFAYAFFAFPVGSGNRSPITGKGEIILMDQALFHGDIQKFFLIDFKKRSVRLVIEGKSFDAIRKEQQESWESLTIPEHMEHYLSQGMDKKTAMKQDGYGVTYGDHQNPISVS